MPGPEQPISNSYFVLCINLNETIVTVVYRCESWTIKEVVCDAGEDS